MELQILETTGKVAGIGGLALGVIVILFREAIRKVVMPKLTRAQGFRIIVLILVLTWSAGLAGIGAWAWAAREKASASADNSTIKTEGNNSPVIKDVTGTVTINNNSN